MNTDFVNRVREMQRLKEMESKRKVQEQIESYEIKKQTYFNKRRIEIDEMLLQGETHFYIDNGLELFVNHYKKLGFDVQDRNNQYGVPQSEICKGMYSSYYSNRPGHTLIITAKKEATQ